MDRIRSKDFLKKSTFSFFFIYNILIYSSVEKICDIKYKSAHNKIRTPNIYNFMIHFNSSNPLKFCSCSDIYKLLFSFLNFISYKHLKVEINEY